MRIRRTKPECGQMEPDQKQEVAREPESRNKASKELGS